MAARPQGMPRASDFRIQEVELPALAAGEVLLKALYISVDPYMRGRMSDHKSYIAPFELNQPISGGVVAKVEESQTPELKKGDTVFGMLPWSIYSVSKPEALQQLHPSSLPLSYYLGVLGMPGLTAYFGVMNICEPKAGETFVVSGAAGAVGTVVGQIAKLHDCRVVGIVGSDEKATLLKTQFLYDYQAQFPLAQKQLTNWLEKGKIHYMETIVDGFEQLPTAFLGLFTGANTGKMIVRV